MKIKNVFIAGALLVSVLTFAQKDELKALKKIYNKSVPTASELADYKANLSKLESVAVEEADKVSLNYYKSVYPLLEVASIGAEPTAVQLQKIFSIKAISDLANGFNSTLEYEKKSGKKVFTDDIKTKVALIKPRLVNAAVDYGKQDKFNESSAILYSAYLMDKTDQENLYFAASYAVNGKNYTKALEYYYELKNLNYSGEKTLYYAVNKANGTEDYFGEDKNTRDNYVKVLSTHEKPRDEKVISRKGEIYKNIALILVEQGKIGEAKQAILDARKANPDDTSLLITEADFYLKEKDFASYTRIVNEALAKDPNNVQLVFNLGVISADSGKYDEAEKYYKRAMEIDPKYFDAYLNLSELKLRADKDFVDQMKKLGTSDADNKKFDVLRAKQIANYKDTLPYLEKGVELRPDNDAVKRTLLGVYQALEMTDKYKALKAKL
ncbi:tetratricopeptide repeat protein [Flavobacterium sp.]|uniref:tetratricopeptide repeat protein n=1 Tax=Flavobacterium sp. TaxID=239 RepID=UPI002B4B4BA1|nr:tetratricopeptide repeat protein [Flavobacterium sp.]HLP65153.1 tetratricopeptide repeat protein [Flavobacterium sp.]